MSDKKGELPGFYRDPKTGKYYKESLGGIENPSLTKLKKERKEELLQKELPSKPPQISNVMKYRMASELGLVSDKNFERNYFKMRLYNQRLRKEISLNDYLSHKIASVSFIKGMGNSFFGVWDLMENSEYECVIGESIFINTPYRPNLGFKLCKNSIVDMCEGPNNTFVYLFNMPVTGAGCFAFLPQASDDFEGPANPNHWGTMRKSPFFCATNTSSRELFAFGCSGFISFYRRFHLDKTFTVKGRIYSIALDEESNLMVSGNHSGHLYLHDLRQKHLQGELKVSCYCINDSYLVDPNQLIVSGPDNVLCKVDLRMQRPVCEYYGHSASVKKQPFSVANGMLCASGSDNVVRIWLLSGGNPLQEMKPINPENEMRGWLYSDCNKTYLYNFEGHYERIYEL